MHWAVESHIGVLAAILVFFLTLAGIVLRLTPANTEIARRILAFPLAWALYSVPWALLSLAMRFPASMVLSPVFFVLGSMTAVGALVVRPPAVGGFLGGGIPLGTLALFYVSSNPSLQKTASVLAWFAICMVFGGLIGALTGPATFRILQSVEPFRLGLLSSRQNDMREHHSNVSKDGALKPLNNSAPRVGRSVNPHRIFISYAHADNAGSDPRQKYLDRLLEQLRALALENEVSVWSDQDLHIGEDWRTAIRKSIAEANAAVLLISPAFLASDYIRNNELPGLLDKAEQQSLVMLPIILRPCLFREASFKYPDPVHGSKELCLAHFQSANSPDRPLNSLSEHEQDRVLLSIAERLSAILHA